MSIYDFKQMETELVYDDVELSEEAKKELSNGRGDEE